MAKQRAVPEPTGLTRKQKALGWIIALILGTSILLSSFAVVGRTATDEEMSALAAEVDTTASKLDQIEGNFDRMDESLAQMLEDLAQIQANLDAYEAKKRADAIRALENRKVTGDELDKYVVKVALPQGHGSGVVIGDGTYVLTAAHVAQGAPDGQVLIVKQDSTFVDGQVIWIATTNDVALIRIEEALPAAQLECTREPVGAPIEIVGHPHVGDTLDWMHTFAQIGSYSSTYGNTVAEFLWFGGEVYPGNSGGPIFNEEGRVVGIVIALLGVQVGFGYLAPFGYNIAVPSDVICGLMP